MLRLLLIPFKTFALSGVYGFVSAILLGLALNLFVTVRLSGQLPSDQRHGLYLATLLFFLAAFGFFGVSWGLENARNQWISEGAIPSLLDEEIKMRMGRLYIGLLLGIVASVVGLVLVTWPSMLRWSFWGAASCA